MDTRKIKVGCAVIMPNGRPGRVRRVFGKYAKVWAVVQVGADGPMIHVERDTLSLAPIILEKEIPK